jgi:hypothetical protein
LIDEQIGQLNDGDQYPMSKSTDLQIVSIRKTLGTNVKSFSCRLELSIDKSIGEPTDDAAKDDYNFDYKSFNNDENNFPPVKFYQPSHEEIQNMKLYETYIMDQLFE